MSRTGPFSHFPHHNIVRPNRPQQGSFADVLQLRALRLILLCGSTVLEVRICQCVIYPALPLQGQKL